LPLSRAADHLADESLLFYQIVTSARRSLTLSYPAVDERGQELLPGSFLAAVRDCFAGGAIPTQRRRMLVEGHDVDVPLSQAEYRVRVAASWPAGCDGLPGGVRENLIDAHQVAEERFRRREYGVYDGLFRDPLVVEWAGKQFGPQRVFSPTALEDYVACPFRFLLRHVLRLEPLEQPREQIEVTRRGMAFHRALARLHRRLKEQGVHAPSDGVHDEVAREITAAVEEDVERAAGPASKELWKLEGRRLLRSAGRYPAHWGKFLEPWAKYGVAPRPHLFEADFGLPVEEGQTPFPPLVLRSGDVEVRVSGRIDRVDLAQLNDGLGFWIIDYKTGRSGHYTGSDLAEFRKLQLTLYAFAVETVLLAGQNARPLGLAYWLVSESGPKLALPGRSAAAWLEDVARWPAIRETLGAWVPALVTKMRQGAFPLAPRSEHCTQTCPYGQVCRIGQARAVGKAWDLPLPGERA
jgi:ATP-dependent helicase/nuclease subunit B